MITFRSSSWLKGYVLNGGHSCRVPSTSPRLTMSDSARKWDLVALVFLCLVYFNFHGSIHVVTNDRISSIFTAEGYFIVYIYQVFFNHLFVNVHLGRKVLICYSISLLLYVYSDFLFLNKPVTVDCLRTFVFYVGYLICFWFHLQSFTFLIAIMWSSFVVINLVKVFCFVDIFRESALVLLIFSDVFLFCLIYL
jgi:hypothetical protein